MEARLSVQHYILSSSSSRFRFSKFPCFCFLCVFHTMGLSVKQLYWNIAHIPHSSALSMGRSEAAGIRVDTYTSHVRSRAFPSPQQEPGALDAAPAPAPRVPLLSSRTSLLRTGHVNGVRQRGWGFRGCSVCQRGPSCIIFCHRTVQYLVS